MCRFIETIRVVDGVPCNLPYHIARVERTCRHFWNGGPTIPFEEIVRNVTFPSGVSKLRFVYDENGVHDVSCERYVPRKIENLQLVYNDDIDYSFKISDRSALNLLKQRSKADEIIIVRQGMITDTSYTNIVFFDGNQWFTPSTPLLPGTMRASLLDRHTIRERDIRVDDLPLFRSLALVNAMMPLGQLVLPMSSIMYGVTIF